jgi:hypothetical protein
MAMQSCKQGGVAALRLSGEEQKKEVNAKDQTKELVNIEGSCSEPDSPTS